MIRTTRPPSSNLGARVAWDLLQSRRPDVPIVALWYSRLGEPDYPSWMAEFADGEYEDEDGLVITWHKNRGGYARSREGSLVVKRGKCPAAM